MSEPTVTTVETRKPDRYEPAPDTPSPIRPPAPMESDPVGDWEVRVSFLDKIKAAWTIVQLINILRSGMGNWKTTAGAIIAGIATVLNALGIVEIPTEVQTGVLSVALFIIGLFAKDAEPKNS